MRYSSFDPLPSEPTFRDSLAIFARKFRCPLRTSSFRNVNTSKPAPTAPSNGIGIRSGPSRERWNLPKQFTAKVCRSCGNWFSLQLCLIADKRVIDRFS